MLYLYLGTSSRLIRVALSLLIIIKLDSLSALFYLFLFFFFIFCFCYILNGGSTFKLSSWLWPSSLESHCSGDGDWATVKTVSNSCCWSEVVVTLTSGRCQLFTPLSLSYWPRSASFMAAPSPRRSPLNRVNSSGWCFELTVIITSIKRCKRF